MAQQNQDSPSRFGTVVFVATTTVAAQSSGNVASTQLLRTQASSINTADVFWAQTPVATQASTSSDQNLRPNTFQSQSANPQSASYSLDAPIPSGSSGQNNGDQRHENGGQRQDDGDQRQENGDQRQGNGDQRQDSHSQHSSDGNSDTVIIASITAIVGTLLIAVLVLVFLKRRKKAIYFQIVRFKRESDEITALPVYKQDFDTARTPQSGQVGGMRESRPTTAITHISRAAKFLNPPKASAVKPDQPSLVSEKASSTTQSIEIPQRSKKTKRPASLDLPPMRKIGSMEAHIGLSTKRSLRSIRSEKGLSSPLDSPGARWSWTNSQAPSTPRIAPPNTRPSLTGRSIRSVASWFSGHEFEDRPSSQRSHRRKRSNPLLWKNQAHRPILAPRPSVKRPASSLGSRAARLSGSCASGRRTTMSQRMDDQRPLTPSARRSSCSSSP